MRLGSLLSYYFDIIFFCVFKRSSSRLSTEYKHKLYALPPASSKSVLDNNHYNFHSAFIWYILISCQTFFINTISFDLFFTIIMTIFEYSISFLKNVGSVLEIVIIFECFCYIMLWQIIFISARRDWYNCLVSVIEMKRNLINMQGFRWTLYYWNYLSQMFKNVYLSPSFGIRSYLHYRMQMCGN